MSFKIGLISFMHYSLSFNVYSRGDVEMYIPLGSDGSRSF